MDEQLTYKLLKIMKHNGNVWELIYSGYEFGQVAFFLDMIKHNQYISIDETGKASISSAGETFITEFESNNCIKQYSKWILPRNEMWQKPVNPAFIYIPKG